MSNEPLAVFVYGTLKRGEEREGMWPHPPDEIAPAVIRACLFDLGPYPAIAAGDDLVRGELWRLPAAAMPATLAALDEIECFGQGGVDLYVRRVVACVTDDGATHDAHTYFIADNSALDRGRQIAPGEQGWAEWPARRD